jgi:hypothetical protein
MKTLTGAIVAAVLLFLAMPGTSQAGSARGFGGSSARSGLPGHVGSARGFVGPQTRGGQPSAVGNPRSFVGPYRYGGHPAWSGPPAGARSYPGWGARPWWGYHRPWWGPGVWGGWYPSYYYGDPSVIVQQPPVYVEPTPPAQQFWYYCQNPQGYYPYVKDCPFGWVQIIPQSASPDR